MAERWVVVTRYIRPSDGRAVRHVYVGDDGLPLGTRAQAFGVARRMLRDDRKRLGGDAVDRAIVDGTLEVHAVKIVDLP